VAAVADSYPAAIYSGTFLCVDRDSAIECG
jgi:hypothetical protein